MADQVICINLALYRVPHLGAIRKLWLGPRGMLVGNTAQGAQLPIFSLQVLMIKDNAYRIMVHNNVFCQRSHLFVSFGQEKLRMFPDFATIPFSSFPNAHSPQNQVLTRCGREWRRS